MAHAIENLEQALLVTNSAKHHLKQEQTGLIAAGEIFSQHHAQTYQTFLYMESMANKLAKAGIDNDPELLAMKTAEKICEKMSSLILLMVDVQQEVTTAASQFDILGDMLDSLTA